jgi:sugar phosphate isomerase/epimerase
MKKGLIAVQMMVLKKQVEELGAYETLKRLHDLGFHAIELSQIPMTPENVSEIKRACEDFDIEVIAMSAALEGPNENLTDDFDKIVKDMATLGCKTLRVGMLPIPYMVSREKALDFVARMEEKAEALEPHGISLHYHNHHIEFTKYDGQYLLDLIRENTKKIGFELDVYWIQRGGENPVSYTAKFKDRVKLYHLKDYRIAQLTLPEEDPELSAEEKARRWNEHYYGVIQFAELGQGNLPWKEIIKAGQDAGAEYFIIEQDDTYGRDPFESLDMSARYLREIGYEDWFTR